MRIATLSFVILGLSLSACYNKEFNEPGRIAIDRQPTERTYDVHFSRVWAAAQQVMSRFPLERRNEDNSGTRGFIVTEWVDGHSDILYSGFGDARVPYRIRYKMYIYVIGNQAEGQTSVQIENVEQYRDDVITAGVDFEGSVDTWIRTESSTLKEARVLDEIQRLIADRNFQPSNDSR